MNLEACTEAIRTKVGADSGLAATLKFDSVSNENRDADCTVGIKLEDLNALLTGDLEPATGFMMGKLKVSGDMSVAMRLQRVI